MPERPIILFPTPERASKEKGQGFPPLIVKRPPVSRQYDRLRPAFKELQEAFEKKRIQLQDSPAGMDPEYAVVFEVVGSVNSFYSAVMRSKGLDWLFEQDAIAIEPSEEFYYVGKEEAPISGKIYCLMSNQKALEELLHSWDRFSKGEDVFARGYKGLRDIFMNIVNVRQWNAADRIAETGVMEYWKDSLSIDGDETVPFEIELFYRRDEDKRKNAERIVSIEIEKNEGKVLRSCVIEEIAYHAILVQMPRNQVQRFVESYDEVKLVRIDDIMYFRPICQAAFQSMTENERWNGKAETFNGTLPDPIIGIFDGMPLQNHPLLYNRVVVDDPEGYEQGYQVKHRAHGTAMASLILNGDLNKEEILNQRVYLRPILKAKVFPNGEFSEEVPPDCMIVDKIHAAVIRMFGTNDDSKGVAISVRIINLSIGDAARQLATEMSPLARLLDYLAYRYKVLFIVSAGNHPEFEMMIECSFDELKNKSIEERSKEIYRVIVHNQRNLKLLSPGEQMNGLTIGALYDDYCDTIETGRAVFAVEKGLPSPISAFGRGYQSMITPDLYYMGGRKFLREDVISKNSRWVRSNSAPGCKVAAPPYNDGTMHGQSYSYGTSDAAALISHEALKCYEVLQDIYINETGSLPDRDMIPILIKAMLVHGASWDRLYNRMSELTGANRQNMEQWLGNGIPDISRVEACAENRITLIGTGALKRDEGNVFHLPLPVDISSKVIKRRLTVTLAYFSPVVPQRQAYRGIKLWFDVEGAEKLADGRMNTDYHRVRKGTLQHEIFERVSAESWDEGNEICIRVSCKEEAGKGFGLIPYALFVTFEVAEEHNVDVYSKVANKIKQLVKNVGD